MIVLNKLQALALRLRKDESGAVATEYAFLVAFIAIVAALGMVVTALALVIYFDTAPEPAPVDPKTA